MESLGPGFGDRRGPRRPSGRLGAVSALVGTVLGLALTLALLALLAFALTMLVRMVVVRDPDAGPHLPTFLVIYVVILVPIGIAWARGNGAARNLRPDEVTGLFTNTLTLAMGERNGRPAAQVEFAESGAAQTRIEALVVSTMTASDLAVLQRLIETGRRRPAREDPLDRIALSPRDLGALAAGSEALRRPLLALMQDSGGRVAAHARRSLPPDLVALWVDQWADEATLDAADPAPSEGGPAARVVTATPHTPKAPGTGASGPDSAVVARLVVVGYALIALYVIAGILLVALSGTGIFQESPWDAVSALTLLGGPFLVWGWFGFAAWVRMMADRHAPLARRADSAHRFWFFGQVSAIILGFLIALVALTGWIMDDDWSAPILVGSLGGLVLVTVLANLSVRRLRAWERRTADAEQRERV